MDSFLLDTTGKGSSLFEDYRQVKKLYKDVLVIFRCSGDENIVLLTQKDAIVVSASELHSGKDTSMLSVRRFKEEHIQKYFTFTTNGSTGQSSISGYPDYILHIDSHKKKVWDAVHRIPLYCIYCDYTSIISSPTVFVYGINRNNRGVPIFVRRKLECPFSLTDCLSYYMTDPFVTT